MLKSETFDKSECQTYTREWKAL